MELTVGQLVSPYRYVIKSQCHALIADHSAEVEVKDILPGVDVVGISVGDNSIVLPNAELRHSIGYSSGIT